MCDSKTKQIIEQMTPTPKLKIKWFVELDEYDGMNRQMMEQKGLWSTFQMSKANIIKKALDQSKDTLFLDSILTHYGFSHELYKKTLDSYVKNPEEMLSVLNEIRDSLSH